LQALASRTDAEKLAITQAAQRALCEASFVDFLYFLKIRSDDPLHTDLIPLRPWPYQVERAEAWERGESEVILKERQFGFSYALVAPYMLWRAMYHGWTCGYLSKGEKEAYEEILRIQSLYDSLPAFIKTPNAKIRAEDATFEGGGRIIAFPATASAGISYTLQLVVMDEAAFHPYGAGNYAAIRPAANRGQFIIQSTADPEIGPSGFFHDMYWNSKKGLTPYNAVFVARVRPDRDAAWYVNEERAYAGDPERYNAYYPETDAQAFVGKSGLVYPMFSTDRHVKAPTFRIEDAKRVVAGVDFGGGDPTAVVILGMDGVGRIHQFAEFYERGPVGADKIGGFISRFKVDAVMCDPSQGTAIATLNQTFGLPARPADNRRGDGLGFVAFLLENDRLTIDPSCKDSIAEFPGYRWAQRTDPNDKTRYATTTAVDNHADAMDARRYAVAELLALLMANNRLPTTSLSGRPLAKVAV
jgi:hypothetical protein